MITTFHKNLPAVEVPVNNNRQATTMHAFKIEAVVLFLNPVKNITNQVKMAERERPAIFFISMTLEFSGDPCNLKPIGGRIMNTIPNKQRTLNARLTISPGFLRKVRKLNNPITKEIPAVMMASTW